MNYKIFFFVLVIFFSKFADLAGTDKDQSRAYLKEIAKKQQGNVSVPQKSEWEAYNDLTNLLKPYGKKTTDPQDYINADNYLKSLNVGTTGTSDDEKNPFSFNFGQITDKDQYLKAKDDIENIKKKKIPSITFYCITFM